MHKIAALRRCYRTYLAPMMLLSMGVSSSVGFAATASAESNSSAENVTLQEVVVTAEKREERLQNVPISISVLGGSTLDTSTFISSADALSTLPAVAASYVDSVYGGTVISVRGVSAAGGSGGGSSAVGYYVDSIPFGFVTSAFVPDTNIYDLQRIEVLNGPQGTLYGANALNGVVRILTNDANLSQFNFKARSFGSTTDGGGVNYGGDLAANLPIVDGKAAARLVAGEEHTSGWIDGQIGRNINSTDQTNVRLKLDVQPIDQLGVGLTAWHYQKEWNSLPFATSDNVTFQTTPAPGGYQFNAFNVKLDGALSAAHISSATSYIAFSSDGADSLTTIGLNGATLLAVSHSQVLSEELNVVSAQPGAWQWSAGAFYRKEKDDYYLALPTGFSGPASAGQVAPSSIFLDAPLYNSTQAAIYGELTRQFFDDRLELSAGVRYFHDDIISRADMNVIPPQDATGINPSAVASQSSATTPRVVLTWKPSGNLTLYASYAQGFRSGVPQAYIVTDVTPFPAAKPDKLSNYEIGLKGEFLDHRVALSAATYYMNWKDVQQAVTALVTIDGGPVGLNVVANGQNASGVGTEFQIASRPIQALEVNAHFSWNSLHYDQTVISGGIPIFFEGARLNNSPKYTGGVSAAYTFALGTSGLQGQLSAAEDYTSAIAFSTNIVNGLATSKTGNSILLAHAQLSVISGDRWKTSLFVNNLANYRGNLTSTFVPGVSPEYFTRPQPRTVGVMIEYLP